MRSDLARDAPDSLVNRRRARSYQHRNGSVRTTPERHFRSVKPAHKRATRAPDLSVEETALSTAGSRTGLIPSAVSVIELIVQSYQALEHSVASALDAAADLGLDDRLAAGPIAYRKWALGHRQQFNLIFFDQIAGYTAPPNGPTVDAQTAVLRPIAAEYAGAHGRTIDDVLGDDELLDDFLAWWGGPSMGLLPSTSSTTSTGATR
jgi:hypothetical protein